MRLGHANASPPAPRVTANGAAPTWPPRPSATASLCQELAWVRSAWGTQRSVWTARSALGAR